MFIFEVISARFSAVISGKLTVLSNQGLLSWNSVVELEMNWFVTVELNVTSDFLSYTVLCKVGFQRDQTVVKTAK